MAWTLDCIYTDELNTTTGLVQIKADLPAVGSTTVFESNYSYTLGSQDQVFGRPISASASQVRVSFHLQYSAVSNVAALAEFVDSAGDSWAFEVDTSNVYLYKNTTSQAQTTVAAAGLGTGSWYHISCVATASTGGAGVFTLYVDGAQAFEVTGRTTAANFDGVYICGRQSSWSTGTGWTGFCDNAYVELGGGADAHAAGEAKVFVGLLPNAAGTNAQFTSTGTNYVEAQVEDGDTTRNYSTTDAQKDTFNVDSITMPTGYGVSAVHPFVVAKSTNGTEQVELINYDGTNTKTHAGITVGTSYDMYSVRQTLQADDSTDWSADATEINAAGQEFGYQSNL